MTDTSKEAVEALAADHETVASRPDDFVMGHPHHKKTADTLRALAARVEVLRKEVAMTARAEALREAADAVADAGLQDAYDQGHRIHFDDLQEFFAAAILAKLEGGQ